MASALRYLIKGIELILPWALRAAWLGFRLACLSILAFWKNVPNEATHIAIEMQERAMKAGVPLEYDREAYYICFGTAVGMLILGWIIQSFLVVIAVQLFL